MREQTEPPSTKPSSTTDLFLTKPSSTTDLFLIGRNSRGNWVVRDQSGLRGGLFVDRAEALRFALFENGRRPQAVIMVPGVLELDLSRRAAPVRQPRINPRGSRPERKVA
jgi:hypothetical protein